MTRLRTAATSLGESFANPSLRRLQLAWLGSAIGNWAYVVALSVYAYQAGGAKAVGLICVIRLVPAALVSAPLATLADRYPRRRVMIGADLARAVLMVVAAVVIASDGPAPVVYGVVVVATMVGVTFRPAQSALVPRLARTPAELTAANVTSSTIDGVASFAGPALGGLLLAITSIELVFAANALTFVWSAVLVVGIRVREEHHEVRIRESFLTELSAGVGAIARDADVRAVSLLYTVQTLVAGAMSVLVVLTALELLDTGEAGVGYLNAAIGVGGVVGGFVALVLATRGRLAGDFAIGLVLFGLPLALLGLVTSVPVALIALGVVGIGNSIVDVAAITLLQRIVDDEVLGRVLGTLEGMLIGAIGIGALLAPFLADLLGVETALVVSGVVLPIVTLASVLRLRATDRRAAPPPHLALLRRIPFLAVLPEQVIEHLAKTATVVRQPAGTVLVRAGDVGDRFYVISDGEAEVAGRSLHPGDGFGEIALLRDVPRTATVSSVTDVELVALERDPFVAAVSGHEPSAASADDVIAARLGSFRGDWTTD